MSPMQNVLHYPSQRDQNAYLFMCVYMKLNDNCLQLLDYWVNRTLNNLNNRFPVFVPNHPSLITIIHVESIRDLFNRMLTHFRVGSSAFRPDIIEIN